MLLLLPATATSQLSHIHTPGWDDLFTFSGVLLASTGAQATASGVKEAVVWQTETYDIGGWHATNSTDVVVPAGVTKVRVKCSIAWEANAAGYRILNIEVEGNTVIGASAQQLAASPSGITVQINTSSVINVTAADVITCEVKQLSTLELDVLNGTATHFSVEKVQ